MTLGSNPYKVGVRGSNTRFMRIILVQTAQGRKQSPVLKFKIICFPSNWWYLNLKFLFSGHQGTGEVW